MPIIRPPRTQIVLNLGLLGSGTLTVMERAFFTFMAHAQPTDTRECSVSATVEIRCFSGDPDGAYTVDASSLIPPREVAIAGNNDTLLDATTFEEVAWRDVAGGETRADFEARCELLAGDFILQGDGFNIERDRLEGNVHDLLVHHIQLAAARGRYVRKQV